MFDDKEDFREISRELRPDITREQFDEAWAEFEQLKERAEKMKALGIAIHPTFGRAAPACQEVTREALAQTICLAFDTYDEQDGIPALDGHKALHIAGALMAFLSAFPERTAKAIGVVSREAAAECMFKSVAPLSMTGAYHAIDALLASGLIAAMPGEEALFAEIQSWDSNQDGLVIEARVSAIRKMVFDEGR